MAPFDVTHAQEYLLDSAPILTRTASVRSTHTVVQASPSALCQLPAEDQHVYWTDLHTHRAPSKVERVLEKLDNNAIVTSAAFILAYVGILGSL